MPSSVAELGAQAGAAFSVTAATCAKCQRPAGATAGSRGFAVVGIAAAFPACLDGGAARARLASGSGPAGVAGVAARASRDGGAQQRKERTQRQQ
jgi:hypothetical protein